jgi:DNA-binding transcriptional ArsR family regulator
MTSIRRPMVNWSLGTAYDLFASLHVLHHPEKFGLRLSWAAGVRSRLNADQRTILEIAQDLFFSNPIGWVSSLPEPRDAAAVLSALGRITPSERLPILALHADVPAMIKDSLNNIHSRGAWGESNLEQLKTYYQGKQQIPSPEQMVTRLNWWAHCAEFGEQYLEALRVYCEVFFAEEEQRIIPYLLRALERATQLADKLKFTDLMVELSQGVKITAFEEAEEVIFVPSYWITPLVMYDSLIPKHWVVLFGARPADVALVPGEVVPDAMLRALKALSDPTRLLILRYLSDQSQTPSQLAKKLRLRAPTVVHHLSALRLAGLVYVSLDEDEEKRYTVRDEVVRDTFDSIHKFISLKAKE